MYRKRLLCLAVSLLLCALPLSVFCSDTPAGEDAPAAEATAPASPSPEPAGMRPVTDGEIDSGAYDSFYADTLFFGDSLLKSFNSYGYTHKVNDAFLGGAHFAFRVGIPVRYALTMQVPFRGRNVRFMDIVKTLEISRVVIVLGVNDNAGLHQVGSLKHFGELIDAIQAEYPEMEIVIIALTPYTADYCRKLRMSIDVWNSFNIDLRRLCVEKGVGYIDFTEGLKTPEGHLARDMSSDNKYHLSTRGNDVFFRAMRIYAMLRTEPDAFYAGEASVDIVLPRSVTPAA